MFGLFFFSSDFYNKKNFKLYKVVERNSYKTNKKTKESCDNHITGFFS